MRFDGRAARRKVSGQEQRKKREVAPAHGVAASGFIRRGRPEMTTSRELVTLAWPIAAAMLGESAMGLVDAKLVGGLGANALGGVALAATVMYLAYSFVFGAMRGVKVRTAHAVGEGRHRDGYVYARAGALGGAVFGVAVLCACRDLGWLLALVGARGEMITYGRDFLAAITLGAPAACALAALIQHRQAIGDARTPMVVGIAGNIFNAGAAWVAIYGRFGVPAMGVRGGGYATALTQTLELVVVLALLAREERAASAVEPAPIAFGAALRGVFELGAPLGLQFAAEMLAFATFTSVLGGIGAEEIAAHQIGLSVIRVSFLPGIAVAEATSVLVGRSLGARDLRGADRATTSGLIVAAAFMSACGLVFAVFGGQIARALSSDGSVATITTRILLVAAIFQLLDGVNIVLRGALRGAKDVKIVALLGIAIVWACVPTSAWLLGKVAGLGAVGGWIGFVGETTVGAAIFWGRWRRGGWRAAYERAPDPA